MAHQIHLWYPADSATWFFRWTSMALTSLEWVKILLTLCMLSNFSRFFVVCFFFWIIFFQNFFRKYHQSVNQCGSRSDLDTNVCKGYQLNTLAGRVIRQIMETICISRWVVLIIRVVCYLLLLHKELCHMLLTAMFQPAKAHVLIRKFTFCWCMALVLYIYAF